MSPDTIEDQVDYEHLVKSENLKNRSDEPLLEKFKEPILRREFKEPILVAAFKGGPHLSFIKKSRFWGPAGAGPPGPAPEVPIWQFFRESLTVLVF